MRLTPCILATACVPWHEDYTLDEACFRGEVRRLLAAGLENLYIFGTAGEGYAVTDSQFRQIATIFFEEMRASHGLCQLGIIGLSVPQIAARIEMGLEIGYRFFQLSLPSWGALNDRELFTFFDALCGGYPQAQFLHYNAGRGLRVLTGKEYARLAADHPNLVATKVGRRNLGEDIELMTRAPALCHFFTEWDFAYAAGFGPCGLLASISSVNPARTRELFAAGQRQDREALSRQTLALQPVYDALFSAMTAGAHMDGAYDKLYCKLADPTFPLRLLPPYQGASEEEFVLFVEKLKSLNAGWLEDARDV